MELWILARYSDSLKAVYCPQMFPFELEIVDIEERIKILENERREMSKNNGDIMGRIRNSFDEEWKSEIDAKKLYKRLGYTVEINFYCGNNQFSFLMKGNPKNLEKIVEEIINFMVSNPNEQYVMELYCDKGEIKFRYGKTIQ